MGSVVKLVTIFNVRTKDGLKINALFLKQRAPLMNSAVTVMYLHGNAGNIGHR